MRNKINIRSHRYIRTIIEEIINEFHRIRTPNGAYYYSTDRHEVGTYQTLESILPFLLLDFRDQFSDEIAMTIELILGDQEKDGGFPPTPEYNYTGSAIDSTNHAILVLSTALTFFKIETNNTDICVRINNSIENAIKFILNQQNENGGWGFIKHRNCPSRIVSTSHSIYVLSQVNSNTLPKQIRKGVDYLTKIQNDDGGWGFLESEISHISSTALAIRAINEYEKREELDSKTYLAKEKGLRYLLNNKWESAMESVIIPAIPNSLSNDFQIPYYFIPATIISCGFLGWEDEIIKTTYIQIIDEFHQKKKEHYIPDSPLELTSWELAEMCLSLEVFYHFLLCGQNIYNKFVNRFSVARRIEKDGKLIEKLENEQKVLAEQKTILQTEVKRFKKVSPKDEVSTDQLTKLNDVLKSKQKTLKYTLEISMIFFVLMIVFINLFIWKYFGLNTLEIILIINTLVILFSMIPIVRLINNALKKDFDEFSK